ncbi:hypothetical protein V8J88_20340 [Massilia sp. W12]|uniref:hypothetical protein n=1 Tax=Massilia sp. W12 TaxID=3126507 RepID=UPI0030D1430E
MRKFLSICLALASLGLSCAPPLAQAQAQCAYQPAFKTLQQQLPSLSSAQSIQALQQFYAANENAQPCEVARIEQLLDDQETALIRLHMGSVARKPQRLLRCNQFTAKTAQCQSPYEDNTAHPLQNNLRFTPWPAPPHVLRLQVDLPQAKLIGVYQTTLAAALDGKPAKRLGAATQIKLREAEKNLVLIAIYKTPGPWAYRKLVWYFE